jgi:deazaflavin-dependent oxidoreductase (nitroreductase family)
MADDDETRLAIADFHRNVIEEFRAKNGAVGGMFEGSTLALLTTIGAKTGRSRTTPLAYMTIDKTQVVIASAMGSDKNPSWFYNILRHPVVTVEDGHKTFKAVATVPHGESRDRLFEEVIKQDSGFADYQKATSRIIPVVTLQPLPDLGWDRGLGDFVMESHDWLNDRIEEFREIVKGSPSPSNLATAFEPVDSLLTARCSDFCRALTEHHEGEDNGAFALVVDRFPGMNPTTKALKSDHFKISKLQLSLKSELEGFQNGVTDKETVMRLLDLLELDLKAHFLYEERTIVPVLNSIAPAPPAG